MPLNGSLVKDCRFTAVHTAWKAIGADDIDLTPFHRKQDIARAAIPADKLELRSGINFERGGEENCSGAAAGCADTILFRADVLERFNAGLWQRSTDVNVGHNAADIRHLSHI